jgi:Transcriptional regulators
MDILSRVIFWMDMRRSNNDIYYHIAQTILLHQAKIPTMGIEELATLCFTSPATISRFCRKLSFSSYADLKQGLKGMQLVNEDEVYYSPAELEKEDLSSIGLVDKTLSLSINTLKQTYENIDMAIINTVAEALDKAEHIAIFGAYYSQLVARDCQYKFLRLNKFATAFSDEENQLADAQDLNAGDVALLFSVSGHTQNLLEICQIAKNRNATTIIITNKEKSPLAKIADYIIKLGGSESDFTRSSTSGRIACMSIVDILYTALAYKRQQQTK